MTDKAAQPEPPSPEDTFMDAIDQPDQPWRPVEGCRPKICSCEKEHPCIAPPPVTAEATDQLWRQLPVGTWFFCESPSCVERYSVQERTDGGCVLVCSTPWTHERAKEDMKAIAAAHNALRAEAAPSGPKAGEIVDFVDRNYSTSDSPEEQYAVIAKVNEMLEAYAAAVSAPLRRYIDVLKESCKEHFNEKDVLRRELEQIREVLAKAVDRDVKDETPYQLAVIASNAIYWRDRELAGLRGREEKER